MNGPAFIERAHRPDDAMLTGALGRTKTHWDAILSLCKQHEALSTEWKFYGAKYGWQLKVSTGRRAVVYLVPRTGHFSAGVALPDAAMDALRAAELPADVVQAIVDAKRAPEGRPARVEVRGRATAEILKKLIMIKLGS